MKMFMKNVIKGVTAGAFLLSFATTSAASCGAVISETSSLFATQSRTNRDLLIFPARCLNGQPPADDVAQAMTSYNLWVLAVVPNTALLSKIPEMAQILPPSGYTALRLDRERGWVFFTEGFDVNSPLPPSRSFPQDNALLLSTPGLRVKSVEIVRRLDPQVFQGTYFYLAASEKPTIAEGWSEVIALPYSQIDVQLDSGYPVGPLN